MKWLALAAAASVGLGCSTVGTDLCAGVTCAAGRECVGGVCISRDLPRVDGAADLYVPRLDGPVDAAVDSVVFDAANADAAGCSPGTKELVVKVHVEGLSYLRIQGNQAWWFHVAYAAPGLSTTPPSPTTINSVDWTPAWPFSSGIGLHCACESAKFDLCKAGVALGAAPQYSALQKISGPGVVAMHKYPALGNKYRATVLINDTPYGSNWYTFKLTFK